MRKTTYTLLLVFSAACSSCRAQYTVRNVVYRGAERYTQAQLASFTGLQAGSTIGAKQVDEASQRLLESGAFTDVEATLEGPPNSLRVTFTLKQSEEEDLLPLAFENFVWLDPLEREAELHRRIPLYSDRLSDTGNLQTAVKNVLEEMLAARGVQAKVEVQQKQADSTHAAPHISFRVVSPAMLVQDVQLSGVPLTLSAEVAAAIQQMQGRTYDPESEAQFTGHLLQLLHEKGFLDARVKDLRRSPHSGGDGTVQVTLGAAVEPGETYRVSALQWPGSEIAPASEFYQRSAVKVGDVASESTLRESSQVILDAYLQHGFMDARVDLQPQLDPATHQVAYRLAILPGEIYHVGSLHVSGLKGEAQGAFDANWKLLQGAVYDGLYAAKCPQLVTSLKALQPYTSRVETIAHRETHTVDLELSFTERGRS